LIPLLTTLISALSLQEAIRRELDAVALITEQSFIFGYIDGENDFSMGAGPRSPHRVHE